jgi:hypothetical protein
MKYVPDDSGPFVEIQIKRVVTFNRNGNAIPRLFIFFLESPEQPVPDNEHDAVITIEIFFITGMMDPVMRRGYENKFNDPGELPYIFGMDPELVRGIDLVADHILHRMKAGKKQGKEKQELNMDCPANPEINPVIIFFGTVMGYMRSPEKPAFVGKPVYPISNKVDYQNTENECPP